ncbi:thioester-forming surface-anchored protein [Streptococcus dysgalactiae]|uniref:thioester-forming surface-anchored protein n=1 Tax=Streptococcus dysgalactiae TaxID=1334 RepID=UPI00403C8787
MKNIVKKLLITTAAFIVMSGSLGVGTLRVLAEQYYGWNDGTGKESPFFLYVTPTNETKRETKTIVYCFNRDREWPETWSLESEKPANLPLYDKTKGYDKLFKEQAPQFRKNIKNPTNALVSVLENGFPNKNIEKLSQEQARKVTQLAIWYFSDNFPKEHFKHTYSLSDDEYNELNQLITIGEKASEEPSKQNTLDLYVTKTVNSEKNKLYQNLLGSTLIPKTPEEPKPNVPKEPEVPEQPEVPDINVEIVKPEFPEKPLKDPELPESKPKPTPKPEIPKEEDLGTVIGGGNVVETTEDTATGSQGGAHNGVVSIQENKDPIVEETYESPLPGQSGQSGSTTEVEDTKGPDVMIGGQGEVVDIEESLPTEQGQSGSTTEVEDTKGPDVMIGGQGEIVEFEKTLPNEHGQSGSTTEVEDSKPKISIHFDNEWPKEEKTQLPAVEKPKAKVSLPATGEAEHVLSTIVGAMILFLVSLWGLLKRKASKA